MRRNIQVTRTDLVLIWNYEEVTKALLHVRDMEVEHVENGQKAVDLFAKSELGTYSAILMDVRMSVMDGIEATKAIRAMDRPDAKAIPHSHDCQRL